VESSGETAFIVRLEVDDQDNPIKFDANDNS
jgi:hypothetical protein